MVRRRRGRPVDQEVAMMVTALAPLAARTTVSAVGAAGALAGGRGGGAGGAGAAGSSIDLARAETAVSLAFHICFAVFGVGLPWLLLYTERRWLVTGDPVWYALTRTWSRAFAVLFAIGAVSGTVLSFEFGLLWPAFMARYGGVLGLSFTLEGFAFFAEAIFIGLYLYGWRRLSPRAHWWTMVPIAVAGTASTVFIITANAWMNVPRGAREVNGTVVSAEPLAPFTTASAPPQVVHMLLAALMCTGGMVAAVYAVGLLRGRRDDYHRRGMRVGLVTVLACAPLQLVAGDWAARVVGAKQPAKLAAMEGLLRTRAGAPLTIGGIVDGDRIRFGVEIPRGLSLLEHFDPDHVVRGLDVVPPADRPNAALVHGAFTVMVGLGTAVLALAAAVAFVVWRRRRDHRRSGAGVGVGAGAGPGAGAPRHPSCQPDGGGWPRTPPPARPACWPCSPAGR
jgi:cytochrome d ubiquinol oxidase subunit I